MKKKPSSSALSSQRSLKKPDALDEISKKLSSSSALNGGFETLLYKIDKIEQSQGQLVSKVDKIHDAIYDPNDGIFSKLGEYKLENASKVNEIEQNINELSLWKEAKDKEEDKAEKTEDKTKEKITNLEKSVDSLVRNKNNTWAVLKWFLVAVGGGMITLTVKWIETKIH